MITTHLKNKNKPKPKFTQSRTNKFFEEEANTIQFKSFENTRDTFYTQSVESGFKKNLFYPNSSSHFQERKYSAHSRNNSRVSTSKEINMKFALSSSFLPQIGNRKNHSPILRIEKEKSYNSKFYIKKLKKAKSASMIKDLNVIS